MQLTDYAQSLVDYVNTNTRYGEIGSHMFLDSCLEPNWRQMQAPPDAQTVGTWDGVEDDDDDL